MKIKHIIPIFFLLTIVSHAQGKYLTKQGSVSFFSSTPVEDIKVENNQVLSVLDSGSGKVAIAILMKSFMFEKSLMQEHFNENYVESDKFPKAVFKGGVQNFDRLKSGENNVTINGNLTIHGVTQKVEIKAVLSKLKEQIALSGEFSVKIAEFGIDIPSAVTNNIAKAIAVSFELNHKPYEK